MAESVVFLDWYIFLAKQKRRERGQIRFDNASLLALFKLPTLFVGTYGMRLFYHERTCGSIFAECSWFLPYSVYE